MKVSTTKDSDTLHNRSFINPMDPFKKDGSDSFQSMPMEPGNQIRDHYLDTVRKAKAKSLPPVVDYPDPKDKKNSPEKSNRKVSWQERSKSLFFLLLFVVASILFLLIFL